MKSAPDLILSMKLRLKSGRKPQAWDTYTLTQDKICSGIFETDQTLVEIAICTVLYCSTTRFGLYNSLFFCAISLLYSYYITTVQNKSVSQ